MTEWMSSNSLKSYVDCPQGITTFPKDKMAALHKYLEMTPSVLYYVF